jgi:hypothetical protein
MTILKAKNDGRIYEWCSFIRINSKILMSYETTTSSGIWPRTIEIIPSCYLIQVGTTWEELELHLPEILKQDDVIFRGLRHDL